MATLDGEYTFSPEGFRVTDSMKTSFDDQGYILVRNMFDCNEIANLRKVFEETDIIKDHWFGIDDGKGRKGTMVSWNQPGNDVSGMVARCEKVVNTCEALLGGEVYHYHGKLVYKDAYTGGSFLWHQDYGYWYNNTCLFPDMLTAFIAIDKCSKSNGCLEIIPRSHKCGRIDHLVVHGQTSADVDRVTAVERVCPKVYVEMNQGDVLFFHCNLLHKSGANEGPDRRWAYLLAYNTRANNALVPHHHAQYTPIQKVADSAVKDCTVYDDFAGKDFMDPTDTESAANALLNKQAVCEK